MIQKLYGILCSAWIIRINAAGPDLDKILCEASDLMWSAEQSIQEFSKFCRVDHAELMKSLDYIDSNKLYNKEEAFVVFRNKVGDFLNVASTYVVNCSPVEAACINTHIANLNTKYQYFNTCLQ